MLSGARNGVVVVGSHSICASVSIPLPAPLPLLFALLLSFYLGTCHSAICVPCVNACTYVTTLFGKTQTQLDRGWRNAFDTLLQRQSPASNARICSGGPPSRPRRGCPALARGCPRTRRGPGPRVTIAEPTYRRLQSHHRKPPVITTAMSSQSQSMLLLVFLLCTLPPRARIEVPIR